MNVKSYIINLSAFYDEFTGSVEKERAVDVVYLDFSKAFRPVFCNTLVDKMMKCRLYS